MKNIMGIAVSDHFKKKGIGRALLSAIEDWAQKDGGDKQQINFRKMF